MEYRIVSAAYLFDEVGCYEKYREAFDRIGAKIMTDIETGNVSIVANFTTIEQLEDFARTVRHDLSFPCERPNYPYDLTIYIKDGYME